MAEGLNTITNVVGFNVYKHKNTAVNDAFDRLTAGIFLYKKTEGYTTFTVTGCERKAGATSIAINLAVALSITGCKTALVDMDIRKYSLNKRLSENAQFGLSNYLEDAVPLSRITCVTNYKNLDYIAFGQKLDNVVELLCSPQFDDFIRQLRETYDYVIFDSPSVNMAADASFLALKTDAVILVARQNKTKQSIIANAKREMDNVGANLLGIVLNNVGRDEYRKFLKDYNNFKQKPPAGSYARC